MPEYQNTIYILLKARDEASAKIEKATKNFEKLNKSGNSILGNENYRTISKSITQLETVNSRIKSIEKAMRPVRKSFDFASLSMLLFGMQVLRWGQQIWTTTTKVFQDVMHSTEGTVTQFDRLNGTFDMIKFSIGAALEPIAGLLVPILEKVIEWIEKNEDLVRAIVVGIIGAGGIMFYFGVLKVGIDGVIQKFTEIVTFLKTTDWAGYGALIQQGIGIISISFSVVQAFEAIEALKQGNYWKATKDAIQTGLLAVGGFKLYTGKGGTSGGVMVAIGVAMELVEEGAFIQSLMAPVNGIMSLMYTIGRYFVVTVENLLINMLNLIRPKIAELLNPIIDAYNFFANKDMKRISTTKLKTTEFDFMNEWGITFRDWQSKAENMDTWMNNVGKNLSEEKNWGFTPSQATIDKLNSGQSVTINNIKIDSYDELMYYLNRNSNLQTSNVNYGAYCPAR